VAKRYDPNGVKEISVRTEGTDRIVIELPGDMGAASTSQVESKLGEALPELSGAEDTLTLADGTGFSLSGVVKIGNEEIHYARRNGSVLYGLTRHNNGKTDAHAAEDAVRLVDSDSIRDAIENLGELSFALVAEESDFAGKATDLSAEQNKLKTWMDANPGVPVVDFNQVPPDKGGPDPSIR
jgi:preprotein translocase subunit SecD